MTTDPMRTAERVLDHLDPAAEAQVVVDVGGAALTRFANSAIHQNVAEETTSIWLTLALDGRLATASGNQTDEDSLRRLVERATEAARVRPPDPGWPGLAPPESGEPPAGPADHHDEATGRATPAERAALVGGFLGATAGLSAAGFCSTDAVTRAYASSTGLRRRGRGTTAVLDGIARTATSDGSARHASARLADLDGDRVGRSAARTARRAADPATLAPGRYEVVLAPGCVVDLLAFLAVYGFNARAVAEGRSFARVGEAQFDPAVSVADDATDPRTVGLGFDIEGTPRRRVPLVTAGVTTGLAHDRRTARAAGTQSTGHAIPGGESFGAVPANLVLAAGGSTAADLLGSVRRGLLVTDFWYTRILDPRTQVVTGLTRNGVFLVEDGEVVRPVRNLRFTQSYVEALAPGRVLGVGAELALVPSSFYGYCLVPSLRLAEWSFTGGADG